MSSTIDIYVSYAQVDGEVVKPCKGRGFGYRRLQVFAAWGSAVFRQARHPQLRFHEGWVGSDRGSVGQLLEMLRARPSVAREMVASESREE